MAVDGRGLAILALAGFLLAACRTMPEFSASDYVRVESLFFTVEQELCEAVAQIGADPAMVAALAEAGVSVDNQYAKATAGLKLVRSVDAAGNASFVIPVTHGTAGLGLGATLRRQETVDTSVSVYYPFPELECAGENPDPPERIAGGLGLREWVVNTTGALARVRETPAAYSFEVSFNVVSDGRARPSIALAPPGLRLLGADASLGAARSLTHTILVTVRDVTSEGRYYEFYGGRPQGAARSGGGGRRGAGRGGGRRGVPQAVRDELDREEGLTILRRIRE